MTTTPPEHPDEGQATPPPGHGTPPPPGYGTPPPAGYGPPSGQLSQQDERMWAMLSHIGAVVLGFIAPLIVMLVQGDKSPFTRANSVESLNFQLTLLIVGIPLTIITCGLGAVIFVVGIVFEIIGGVKANNGEMYRYPVNIRMVK